MEKVSVIIPSRNEEYLEATVNNLLEKAGEKIEIVVALDGHDKNPLKEHPQIKPVLINPAGGMRNAINVAAKNATGTYLMKCDAHCAFDKDFDVKLKKAHKDDWVQVPRRYAIDKNKWTKHENKNYYHDFQYISHPKDPNYTFKGVDWPAYGARVRGEKICDLMTSQGSCWFMTKGFFENVIVELDDKNYGTMGAEAQEICLKTWQSGGRYVLNKNTWYAHKKKRVGKRKNEYGYRKPAGQWRKSRKYAIEYWIKGDGRPTVDKLVKKFKPVPGWHTKMESLKTCRFIQEKYKLNYACSKFPRKIDGLNRDGLVKLWKELGFKVGAEIGVDKGRLAHIMFKGIPDLKMYLIDPYEPYKDIARHVRRRPEAKQMAHDLLRDKDAEWIEEFSETAFNKIEDGSLDFVYIDGNHYFDYVMLDIILWQRKVRRGGMICGHDYNTHNRKGKREVAKAVDDYIEMHKIAPWYITDNKAQHYKADRHASWFWVKE